MPSAQKSAALRKAQAHATKNPERIAQASRELALANIEAAIERNLASSPPLTPEQKKRIAALLRTGSQR